MDRYKRVEMKKSDSPINENEIRITSQGLVRNYISYANTLLQERRGREIVLKGMGHAISKTVAIAEIIKRNIPRLHQDTEISSVSITDLWEPIEEGLLPVKMTRHVSMISITLSSKELDKSPPGYQAPFHVERPRPQYNNYQQQQQPKLARQGYNAVNEEPYGGSYQGNRGRDQGGRRGGRGRSGSNRSGFSNYQRGGYGNYQGGSGYGNHPGGRYRNYQGSAGYGNYQGSAGYGNYQENNGYANQDRGGGHGGNAGYRGRGGGGRMGGRPYQQRFGG